MIMLTLLHHYLLFSPLPFFLFSLVVPKSQPDVNCSTYQTCRLTYGGDWEWNSNILGLQKATSTFFCPHCLVSAPALRKGVPHSVELHHTDGSQTFRTLELMCIDNDRFLEEHPHDRKYAKDYHNQIYRPLIRESGFVIDTVSVSPMHISLGLGLQNVNILEDMSVSSDAEIKEDGCKYSEYMRSLFQRRDHMSAELVRLERIRMDLEQELADTNGMITDLSVDKRRNRDQIQELKEEVKRLKDELKLNDTERKDTDSVMSSIVEAIESAKGPFLTDFHDVMDSLHLKRVVYHSGALIGNDVRKTLRPENIEKFAAVFEPKQFLTDDGEMKVYGSHDNVVKVRMLLSKFASCYELYHRNSPLCKHEVEKLAFHCADYGSWFPQSFPEASLIRKFHLLTHEVPRQARRLHTVGMLIEQVTESIHPFMNKMDYMFIQTQDTFQRQRLMCRQFNLFARSQHL